MRVSMKLAPPPLSLYLLSNYPEMNQDLSRTQRWAAHCTCCNNGWQIGRTWKMSNDWACPTQLSPQKRARLFRGCPSSIAQLFNCPPILLGTCCMPVIDNGYSDLFSPLITFCGVRWFFFPPNFVLRTYVHMCRSNTRDKPINFGRAGISFSVPIFLRRTFCKMGVLNKARVLFVAPKWYMHGASAQIKGERVG